MVGRAYLRYSIHYPKTRDSIRFEAYAHAGTPKDIEPDMPDAANPDQESAGPHAGLANLLVEFNQMKSFMDDPLVIVEADGVRVRDHSGQWYIDGLSAVAAVQLGHRNQAIIAAMTEQLNKVALALPLYAASEPAIDLATRLVEITPAPLTHVKYTTGGSEANETAFKVARQYHAQTGSPGKYKIISRYRSYHGATMGALAASGGAARKFPYEPFPTGFLKVHPPDCYRCPFGLSYPECGVQCAEIVDDVIRSEDPGSVAAFIAEPVTMSADGFIVPPSEYFKILRDICDRHNVLLIFDEIITGFGRLGELFGADVYNTTPDLMTLGKGLSGGYAPLAALMMTTPIAEAFWGDPTDAVHFNGGHTYAGNPVACAAGLEAISQIVEGGALANGQKQGARLRAGMEVLADRYEQIGRVDGHGLLQGIEFVKEGSARLPFPPSHLLCRKVGLTAKSNGLIGRMGDHEFVLAPPLTSTSDEIDEMLEILDTSIAESLETFDG